MADTSHKGSPRQLDPEGGGKSQDVEGPRVGSGVKKKDSITTLLEGDTIKVLITHPDDDDDNQILHQSADRPANSTSEAAATSKAAPSVVKPVNKASKSVVKVSDKDLSATGKTDKDTKAFTEAKSAAEATASNTEAVSSISADKTNSKCTTFAKTAAKTATTSTDTSRTMNTSITTAISTIAGTSTASEMAAETAATSTKTAAKPFTTTPVITSVISDNTNTKFDYDKTNTCTKINVDKPNAQSKAAALTKKAVEEKSKAATDKKEIEDTTATGDNSTVIDNDITNPIGMNLLKSSEDSHELSDSSESIIVSSLEDVYDENQLTITNKNQVIKNHPLGKSGHIADVLST